MDLNTYAELLLQSLMLALARWSVEGAKFAVLTLLSSFGNATEPDFAAIAEPYSRMLAIGLLVIGGFVSMALVEGQLGGSRGAGLNVLPRTLAGCFMAFTGLGIVQYAEGYANLLANAWTYDFLGQNQVLTAKLNQLYSMPLSATVAGSVLSLIVVALLTVLLAVFVYLELVLRAALILVGTTFIPLLSTAAVWPRLSGAATQLAQFLVGLMLSKFVMATAIYVGYSTVVRGLLAAPSADHANAMMVGLATLTVAAFSPVVLFQGISFGQQASAPLVRSWGSSGLQAASSGWGALAKPLKGALSGERLRGLLARRKGMAA